MPEGPHPFPSRTRQLSPPGPMVLRWQRRGRVGRRRGKLLEGGLDGPLRASLTDCAGKASARTARVGEIRAFVFLDGVAVALARRLERQLSWLCPFQRIETTALNG